MGFDAESARRGRETQTAIRDGRIEDYLLIGGPNMPAWQAAGRLHVTRSTIVRYRRTLRDRTGRTDETPTP